MKSPYLDPTEIAEMLNALDARMIAARQELASRHNHPGKEAPTFHLVTEADGGINKTAAMVIVKTGDTFSLHVTAPDRGYAFDTYLRAKRAATRWNKALDVHQKRAGCTVFPCSRTQYLEYCLDHGAELRPLLVRALERSKVLGKSGN
jgi:hypothetical protein